MYLQRDIEETAMDVQEFGRLGHELMAGRCELDEAEAQLILRNQRIWMRLWNLSEQMAEASALQLELLRERQKALLTLGSLTAIRLAAFDEIENADHERSHDLHAESQMAGRDLCELVTKRMPPACAAQTA